jgi:hypothetical protein
MGSKGDQGPKEKYKGHSRNPRKKNRLKCWNCEKREHVKKECKTKKETIGFFHTKVLQYVRSLRRLSLMILVGNMSMENVHRNLIQCFH